jgi:2-polyprenyl-3-methyl-5-hydroxy-6-metoxy-1,4-benzoquinol methylase
VCARQARPQGDNEVRQKAGAGMSRDYRTRIYESYASEFQDKGSVFDSVAARRWGRAYEWYLRNWLPADKSANIVDLACGAGELLYFFRERGYARVSGVDISPAQIALSRQVTDDVVQDGVHEFLRIRQGTFDLITAVDLVEHLSKDEVLVFLDDCHAALRPGGRMILQTPNAESPWVASCRYGDFTHEVCFQSNALSRLMRMTGFVEIQTREQGPIPLGYSAVSTGRYLLWRVIRACLQFYNAVETGSLGSGVFTRVFLVSGIKTDG